MWEPPAGRESRPRERCALSALRWAGCDGGGLPSRLPGSVDRGWGGGALLRCATAMLGPTTCAAPISGRSHTPAATTPTTPFPIVCPFLFLSRRGHQGLVLVTKAGRRRPVSKTLAVLIGP